MVSKKFSSNVITLLSGTAIAQAIPIAISPILTRVYSPEDFGVFALYTTLVSILSITATGRYEQAIILPSDDQDALSLLTLSVLMSCAFSLLIALIVYFFNAEICSVFNNDSISDWLYLLPISIVSMATYQALSCWHNRYQDYTVIAYSRVNQTASASVVQVSPLVLGSWGNGLIVGAFLGQCFSVFYFISKSIGNLKRIARLQPSNIFSMAERYKRFPKYLILGHSLNSISMQAPVILLSVYFSSLVTGYYSLTQRIIAGPMSIISRSVGEVFRQEASRVYSERNECREIYVSVLKKLLLIAIVPFTLLYFYSVDLFIIIFGDQWATAGEYAKILIPMFFLQFISSPLSSMYVIAEKNRQDLIFQTVLFLFSIIPFVFFATQGDGVEKAIFVFSVSYSIIYLVNIYITYKFSCGDSNEL